MAVVDRWHKRVDGRKVRTARYGVGKRWLVRWRDGDEEQRSRSFDTRDAAEDFWAELRATPKTRDSRRTVGDQWLLWIVSKGGVKPATLHDYRQQWRLRVQPRWGSVALVDVRHDDVAAWVGELAAGLSASTVRRAYVVLSGIVRMALRSGVLHDDQTAGVRLPRSGQRDLRVVTLDEVRRLADECAPHQLVVWTLALTGIRWGELCALRPTDLDAGRRRLRIARSRSEIQGVVVETTPKSGRARDVAVPDWLADQLAQVEGDWLFPTQYGGPWRSSSWRRVWRGEKGRPGAVQRAGLPDLRVHDLRHAYASLAIASGADVKAVQRSLGHASAAMTLDRYGHLWEAGIDDVAQRLGRLSEG